jgi:hypothetical protein
LNNFSPTESDLGKGNGKSSSNCLASFC